MNNEGWECPKCGRVYSPNTSMCFSCGGIKTTASKIKDTSWKDIIPPDTRTQGLTVEWTNKDVLSSGGSNE